MAVAAINIALQDGEMATNLPTPRTGTASPAGPLQRFDLARVTDPLPPAAWRLGRQLRALGTRIVPVVE